MDALAFRWDICYIFREVRGIMGYVHHVEADEPNCSGCTHWAA